MVIALSKFCKGFTKPTDGVDHGLLTLKKLGLNCVQLDK